MCQQSPVLQEAPGETMFPCLFQLLEFTSIPWFLTPSLHFPTSSSIVISPSWWPSQPLSCKDSCDHIRPNREIQGDLPISRSLMQSYLQDAFFRIQLTYLQNLVMRMLTYWRDQYFPRVKYLYRDLTVRNWDLEMLQKDSEYRMVLLWNAYSWYQLFLAMEM